MVIVMEQEKTFWGFHNTRDEIGILEGNYIAIGWKEMGDLSQLDSTRDAYYEKYSVIYPDAKKGSILQSASQIFRFINSGR